MHFQPASVRIELAGGNAVIYKYASSQAASFVKVRYGDAGGMLGCGVGCGAQRSASDPLRCVRSASAAPTSTAFQNSACPVLRDASRPCQHVVQVLRSDEPFRRFTLTLNSGLSQSSESRPCN